MTIEEHIKGLKVIKPYLQKKMLEINYEGLGELDALQVGETIDFAIESIKELETCKKALALLIKAYKLACSELDEHARHPNCELDPISNRGKEAILEFFIDKAREELENDK